MNPKYKIHDKLQIAGRVCNVTAIDSFGTTVHYGLLWLDIPNYESGWIPVQLLDNMTEPTVIKLN